LRKRERRMKTGLRRPVFLRVRVGGILQMA
jgi:hypothetical protein